MIYLLWTLLICNYLMAWKESSMKRKIITAAILSAFLFSVIYFFPVRADVAPPQQPPGSSVGPEGDTTQVRMMAETVIINILKDVISGTDGQALIDANFTMRNLGNDTEYMNVRFPLADPS
jgi:hypothetical protein